MNAPTRQTLLEEEVTRSIIGAFYTVYRGLGFGFLEHVYASALEKEISSRGHRLSREVLVPIHYLGDLIAYHRLDMLVDDCVIVELKSSERLPPIAERQLYSYLRCTNLEVGLLLHFGHEPRFKRVILTNDQKQRRIQASNSSVSHPSESVPSVSQIQSKPTRGELDSPR
jgi:GxxExxY protein